MLQLINKFANVQISVTKRLTPFRNAVALINNYHKDIRKDLEEGSQRQAELSLCDAGTFTEQYL